MCALEREQRVTQLQLHRGQADRWHVSHGVQNVLLFLKILLSVQVFVVVFFPIIEV